MAREGYPDTTQLSALQIVGLLVARIEALPRGEAARALELARQALAQAERASAGLALRDTIVRTREAGWKSLFRGPGKSGPAPAAAPAAPAATPARKLTLQERVKALKPRHR